MDLIISQPAAVSIDLTAWHHRGRIARIGALIPEDTTAGLIWLALNYPATCDAMLDKIEWDGIDDEDPATEPEPYCAPCGSQAGMATKLLRDLRALAKRQGGEAGFAKRVLDIRAQYPGRPGLQSRFDEAGLPQQ